MSTVTTLRIELLALLSPSCLGFFVSLPTNRPGVARHCGSLHSSILTSAIETFDGSQIVDPIIVSGIFWSSLKTRLVSLIIGQVLATIVFGILATITASQLSKFGEWIASAIGEEVKNSVYPDASKARFVKAEEAKYAPIPIDIAKLCLCIFIDVIGSSSELLPIVGEATDIIWAPIAAIMMRKLFYGSNVVLVLEFAEEILPFTDILPLATLCWVVDTFFGESATAHALGIGNSRRIDLKDDSAIDVTVKSREMNDDEKRLPNRKPNP